MACLFVLSSGQVFKKISGSHFLSVCKFHLMYSFYFLYQSGVSDMESRDKIEELQNNIGALKKQNSQLKNKVR